MSDLKDDLESLRLPPAAARRPRRRWRPAVIVPILVALAVVFGWRLRGGPLEVDTVTATVDQGSSAGDPVLTASGYVVARRRAVVSAKIQGRLERLDVEEGARVVEGAVFARLESADFQAAVARARAQLARADSQIASAGAQTGSADAAVARAAADLAEARRQLDVADRLTKEEVVSTDQRDATRSRVAVAEAIVAQARADRVRADADVARARAERDQAAADVTYNEALLQNTFIRAPFTGTVVRKMAEVGESVAPIPPGVNISTASGAIVALADLDTLEVEVDVAEANVAKLVAEQPAEVIVEAFPETTFKGVLRQVIPTADRTRATVMVKVTIRDKDARLKPEMSAKVTFVQAGGGAAPSARVLVPQTAVITAGPASHVFVVADGVATRRVITLGGTSRDRAVVATGLTGSETLVARPAASLTDGTKVRPKA